MEKSQVITLFLLTVLLVPDVSASDFVTSELEFNADIIFPGLFQVNNIIVHCVQNLIDIGGNTLLWLLLIPLMDPNPAGVSDEEEESTTTTLKYEDNLVYGAQDEYGSPIAPVINSSPLVYGPQDEYGSPIAPVYESPKRYGVFRSFFESSSDLTAKEFLLSAWKGGVKYLGQFTDIVEKLDRLYDEVNLV